MTPGAKLEDNELIFYIVSVFPREEFRYGPAGWLESSLPSLQLY
jgi:hypothetical protein